MAFVIQQPGSALLLETINEAAENAESGGGVFAFATRGGVEALLQAPNVARMLTSGRPFHLVVGVDAITNAEALLYIGDCLSSNPGVLTAEVFFHGNPASTFHPKFSWFHGVEGTRLVVGSGNLTLYGLGQTANGNASPRGNWEAFTTQALAGLEAAEAAQTIEDWLQAQRAAQTMRQINDEGVQNQAIANSRVRYYTPRVVPSPADAQPLIVAQPQPLADTDVGDDILVREIPRNRHGQADVGRTALTDFFGYADIETTIFIQQVTLDDLLEPVREIPLFVNASRNYRLELRGIADLPYDIAADDSRMILVAARLGHRSFRYAIVPVTSSEYDQVATLLGPVPPIAGRARPMRETRVSATNLPDTWTNVPANLLPITAVGPEV